MLPWAQGPLVFMQNLGGNLAGWGKGQRELAPTFRFGGSAQIAVVGS